MGKRLQGKEFQEMRPFLKIICWNESANGNIRVDFRDKQYHNRRYWHWLNDAEKADFEPLKHNYKKYEPKVEKTHDQSI